MTTQYTPRERVMPALNHKESDRVPIDFGTTYMTSITVPPYLALEEALGLPAEPPRLQTPLSKIVLPREGILERFRVDTRGIPRPDAPASWRNQVEADGTLLDEFDTYWKQASDHALSWPKSTSVRRVAYNERRFARRISFVKEA